MDIYKKILKYVKPYKLRLAAGLFCLALVALLDLSFPWLVKSLIDDVLIAGNQTILNLIPLGAILIYFVKGIFNYLQIYLLFGLGHKVVVDLRKDIYEHLQYLSLGFHGRQKTGDLISRMTNDINVIQRSITEGLSSLILQPLTIIGIIGFLLYIDWTLALLAFIIIPLVAFTINKFGRKMRRVSSRIQNKMSLVTAILQETLAGIRVIKAFNTEDLEIDKFSQANEEALEMNMKGVQINATIKPVVEIIIAFGAAGFLWYGGHQVLAGKLTTGELIAFLGYIGMLISPINVLSKSYNLFQQAIGASERIFDILEVDEKITEVENPKQMPKIKGEVEFKRVGFSYNPQEKVLNNIELTASPGEMVALVGPSGAGKTSLVNLVPRFYDPDAGQILIDGIDIKEVTLRSLREQIGIVPQDTLLFNGTIADNIAYGSEEKSREEIIAAAKKANAHQFILEFEDGYDSQVGERGGGLSGGQKQRIAIARAILRDPRILILDEATSALDTKSEALVQEALERLMAARTTFVIAHRLSTVINADKIVVLEEGEIVEVGSHQQLLEEEGHYHNLYQAQLKQNL